MDDDSQTSRNVSIILLLKKKVYSLDMGVENKQKKKQNQYTDLKV